MGRSAAHARAGRGAQAAAAVRPERPRLARPGRSPAPGPARQRRGGDTTSDPIGPPGQPVSGPLPGRIVPAADRLQHLRDRSIPARSTSACCRRSRPHPVRPHDRPGARATVTACQSLAADRREPAAPRSRLAPPGAVVRRSPVGGPAAVVAAGAAASLLPKQWRSASPPADPPQRVRWRDKPPDRWRPRLTIGAAT
jgi:hypothetical protein